MIRNQLIILPHFLPPGFPADFESQTARILAKKNRVIILRPETNPPQTLKIKLKIFLSGRQPIFWTFYPQFENLAGRWGEKLIIYDCVDHHRSINTEQNHFLKKREAAMIKKADIVFVNSPALFKLKKRLHSKVFLVPQGSNTDLFLKTKPQPIPQDLARIPPPRIGFSGNLDYRLDFDLIRNLAAARPDWSLVFIGPDWGNPINNKTINFKKQLSILKKHQNIHFLGFKNKPDLIGYLDHFEIGIIPYQVKFDFVRYSYPMKVFELFARGKPVIATPIEALKPLRPLVITGRNAAGFEKGIQAILDKGWPKRRIRKQKRLALKNSWQRKLEKISQILQKEFPEIIR
ncbi:MAG: glycosyltransferase [Candidatus Pacebacteria bacterium]|nr:glycosyltransferase [Candidatus Paceibacterota bacterium]